jgi:hypothetical protein
MHNILKQRSYKMVSNPTVTNIGVLLAKIKEHSLEEHRKEQNLLKYGAQVTNFFNLPSALKRGRILNTSLTFLLTLFNMHSARRCKT